MKKVEARIRQLHVSDPQLLAAGRGRAHLIHVEKRDTGQSLSAFSASDAGAAFPIVGEPQRCCVRSCRRGQADLGITDPAAYAASLSKPWN